MPLDLFHWFDYSVHSFEPQRFDDARGTLRSLVISFVPRTSVILLWHDTNIFIMANRRIWRHTIVQSALPFGVSTFQILLAHLGFPLGSFSPARVPFIPLFLQNCSCLHRWTFRPQTFLPDNLGRQYYHSLLILRRVGCSERFQCCSAHAHEAITLCARLWFTTSWRWPCGGIPVKDIKNVLLLCWLASTRGPPGTAGGFATIGNWVEGGVFVGVGFLRGGINICSWGT